MGHIQLCLQFNISKTLLGYQFECKNIPMGQIVAEPELAGQNELLKKQNLI